MVRADMQTEVEEFVVGELHVEYLIKRMKKLKIRQQYIAEQVGCTPVALNRKLKGKAPITVREMAVILDTLDISAPDKVFRICGFRPDDSGEA